MTRIFKKLLKNYDPDDKELYLKARFVLVTTIFMISSLSCIILYTSLLSSLASIIIAIEVAGFAIMMVALVMLLKGNYDVAIHAILISAFSVIWGVLFIDSNGSYVIKLDTIVFIPAVLAAMPLMKFKDRRPMVAYFLINITLFGYFNYHIYKVLNLSITDQMDYFFDNLICMIFAFFVSFTLFSIYQRVLNSLKQELSDRKNAETALQESEYRLSAHLRNTPVGAVSWDMEFRVVEWNPAAEKIFGFKKSEAVGKNIVELILPEDIDYLVGDILKKLLSETGGKNSVNENVTKSGKRILCDWYNTVIRNNEDKVIGVASLVNDITEAKKTQEMMIQSEKMMSVGGLAAGMAHELNNPLAGMIQNAEVINNRLTKNLPANIKAAEELDISLASISEYMGKRGILNQLNHISQAGDRAAKIIRNMLTFSRKSGSIREQVNLPELVDATIELAQNDYNLKKHSDFKNIQIVREYSSKLPAILCEKSKIQQVLFNLFKNAAESMSEGERKEESRLTIRLKEELSRVHIEIEDNGSGIDEKTRKRIFEPFFTTKSVDKGTGLGLSVSYFIVVDDHDGDMLIESKPGKGAKFIINLPLQSDKNIANLN